MLHFFDRAGLLGATALPLDPELAALLAERVAHLDREGLLDLTELVVVDRDTTEAELVEAIGFTPLIGLDGVRYGECGFLTAVDYVSRVSPSYHEAIVTVGNGGFAFQLLVHDGADPDLVALCREQAA